MYVDTLAANTLHIKMPRVTLSRASPECVTLYSRSPVQSVRHPITYTVTFSTSIGTEFHVCHRIAVTITGNGCFVVPLLIHDQYSVRICL